MKTVKVFISSLLLVSILLSGLALPVFAQRPRPVVITFGQPNIWSLEQAHYLLARMHRQNLDLQTATLGALDPNATNASRIDILKTLLQAGVSFDQAVALNNELLKRDKVFNSDRRRELLNNRTTLQSESTQLARDIATLKVSKANATDEKDQKQIQDQIDAKTLAVIGDVNFVDMLPKTRSGKIMRRVLRAVTVDKDPGDISTIEDEGSVEEAREAWQRMKEEVRGASRTETATPA